MAHAVRITTSKAKSQIHNRESVHHRAQTFLSIVEFVVNLDGVGVTCAFFVGYRIVMVKRMKHEDYIRECKQGIEDVLTAFQIEHDTITSKSGPTVTLFEFKPRVGTRISKLVSLKNEFAIELGVQSVRIIAPTELGKVGIEVPNRERVVIPMKEMLSSYEYIHSEMELPIIFGRKVDCNIFMADLTEMPHLLIAGATGMGKSVGLNVIISSLISKKSPDEMKLILIDPKQVELTIYDAIKKPYLAKLHENSKAIVTEPLEAQETLRAICDIMDNRYAKLNKAKVRNIKEYNRSCEQGYISDKSLPYYVVIIDEYSDLMMQADGKQMEKYICRIAQKARAVGIHMIISTQRPSSNIVSVNIKANFPTRIAFRTVIWHDSHVILDKSGADKLIGKGDMLYYNGGETTRVQCAFISTQETIELCNDIKEKYPEYETTILEKVILREKPVVQKFDRVHDNTRKVATKIVENGLTELRRGQVYGNTMEQLIEMGIISNLLRKQYEYCYAEYHQVYVHDMETLNLILDTFYDD